MKINISYKGVTVEIDGIKSDTETAVKLIKETIDKVNLSENTYTVSADESLLNNRVSGEEQ